MIGLEDSMLRPDQSWERSPQGLPQPVGKVETRLGVPPKGPAGLLGPHGLGPGLKTRDCQAALQERPMQLLPG